MQAQGIETCRQSAVISWFISLGMISVPRLVKKVQGTLAEQPSDLSPFSHCQAPAWQ
jgi:hypothetical protein